MFFYSTQTHIKSQPSISLNPRAFQTEQGGTHTHTHWPWLRDKTLIVWPHILYQSDNMLNIVTNCQLNNAVGMHNNNNKS